MIATNIHLNKKEVVRKISKREMLSRTRRGLTYTPTADSLIKSIVEAGGGRVDDNNNSRKLKEVKSLMKRMLARLKILTKKDKAKAENPLRRYLTDSAPKNLLPFLRSFSNNRPRYIGYIIFASIKLKFIKESLLNESHANAVNAINKSLGEERLSRRDFSYYITAYYGKDRHFMKGVEVKLKEIEGLD